MSKFYIERREDGRYNVSRPNSGRPSAVTDTQKQGIDRALQIDPNAGLDIERQRNVGPGRDKWRSLYKKRT